MQTTHVKVCTLHMLSGQIDSIKFIDHANSSDRKWLQTHIFWAMRNQRKIDLIPVL